MRALRVFHVAEIEEPLCFTVDLTNLIQFFLAHLTLFDFLRQNILKL